MDCDIKKRTIMIFPQFENINIINEIREKYDPLEKHVRPHISLVFTFESSLTTSEVNEHLKKVLDGIRPFKLTLQQIVKVDNPLGRYLFLDIKQGNKENELQIIYGNFTSIQACLVKSRNIYASYDNRQFCF